MCGQEIDRVTCRHGDEEPCLQVCHRPAERRTQTESYVNGTENETMKPGRSIAGLRHSGLSQTSVFRVTASSTSGERRPKISQTEHR